MKKRKLKKEVLEVNESNDIFSAGHIKEYDENGNILYSSVYHLDEGYSSKFSYDDSGKIINEEIDIRRSYGSPSEKREKKYEYHEFGYRILEYQTKIIDDSSTAPKFKDGGLITAEEYMAEYPRKVNELLSIEDITLNNNGTVRSRKTSNLIDNETKLIEYEYTDNLLAKEVFFDVVMQEKEITKEITLEYREEEAIMVRGISREDAKPYPVVIQKTISYQRQKEPREFTSKYLYSINTDKTITLNHDITNEPYKLDGHGNIFQKSAIEGRIIYINDYLPPDNNLLKSVHEVMICEDSHEVMSKKYFYYFD